MGLEYFNHNDAGMRLDSTVCMYKKEPVYVQCIGTSANPKMVTIYPLGYLKASHAKMVDYTTPEFDYKIGCSGYLNGGSSDIPTYVVRVPVRVQKQGLSVDNVVDSRGSRIGTSQLTSKHMADLLNNNYMSFSRCYARCEKVIEEKGFRENYHIGWAFHRDYCVLFNEEGRVDIKWRGETVVASKLWRGDEKFRLSPSLTKPTIFREALNEMGVPT